MAAQQTMRLLSHALGDRFQEPGFSHPGLARHEGHMPVAARRASPAIIQERQLPLASDDWTGGCGVGGCEPAFDRVLPKRLPDRNRVAEALDGVLAQE